MSSRSEQERDRLKEEYKEHYRKIRDAKEKIRRSRSVKNISDAMGNMNTDELMESVDHFLDKVRLKVASVEARLEVAMENLAGPGEDRLGRNRPAGALSRVRRLYLPEGRREAQQLHRPALDRGQGGGGCAVSEPQYERCRLARALPRCPLPPRGYSTSSPYRTARASSPAWARTTRSSFWI
jgi:hypothetical protein